MLGQITQKHIQMDIVVVEIMQVNDIRLNIIEPAQEKPCSKAICVGLLADNSTEQSTPFCS